MSAAPVAVSSTGESAAVVPMAGGGILTPLPLSGGRRHSKKSRRLTKKAKKAMKLLKKMGGVDAAMEAVKAGAELGAPAAFGEPAEEGGRRRRHTRKHRRSHRRGLLY